MAPALRKEIWEKRKGGGSIVNLATGLGEEGGIVGLLRQRDHGKPGETVRWGVY